MFYDSKTELIQFTTEKVTGKVPWTIYRPDKKSKKDIRELEMNFP